MESLSNRTHFSPHQTSNSNKQHTLTITPPNLIRQAAAWVAAAWLVRSWWSGGGYGAGYAERQRAGGAAGRWQIARSFIIHTVVHRFHNRNAIDRISVNNRDEPLLSRAAIVLSSVHQSSAHQSTVPPVSEGQTSYFVWQSKRTTIKMTADEQTDNAMRSNQSVD